MSDLYLASPEERERMRRDNFDRLVAERRELREALLEARRMLRGAKAEATHGLTANPDYIDRCVAQALSAIDTALGPVSEAKE